jgi:hypothetical protein
MADNYGYAPEQVVELTFAQLQMLRESREADEKELRIPYRQYQVLKSQGLL